MQIYAQDDSMLPNERLRLRLLDVVSEVGERFQWAVLQAVMRMCYWGSGSWYLIVSNHPKEKVEKKQHKLGSYHPGLGENNVSQDKESCT